MTDMHKSTGLLGHPPPRPEEQHLQKPFDLRRGSFHPSLLQGGHGGNHSRGRPSRDFSGLGERRRSTMTRFQNSLSLFMGMRRGTKFGSDSQKSQTSVKRENSYQLEPKTGEMFEARKMEKIMQEILNIQLAGVRYDPSTARDLSCKLSALIKTKIKEVPMPRYKLVCHVIVSQANEQGLHIASRGVWDGSRDNWACATFDNETLCAVASVYGVYYE